MRITTKGQVTIPQSVRKQAGFMPGTDIDFVIEAGTVRLVKAPPGRGRRTRGQLAVERFAGSATTKMTGEELMALLRPEDQDL